MPVPVCAVRWEHRGRYQRAPPPPASPRSRAHTLARSNRLTGHLPVCYSCGCIAVIVTRRPLRIDVVDLHTAVLGARQCVSFLGAGAKTEEHGPGGADGGAQTTSASPFSEDAPPPKPPQPAAKPRSRVTHWPLDQTGLRSTWQQSARGFTSLKNGDRCHCAAVALFAPEDIEEDVRAPHHHRTVH